MKMRWMSVVCAAVACYCNVSTCCYGQWWSGGGGGGGGVIQSVSGGFQHAGSVASGVTHHAGQVASGSAHQAERVVSSRTQYTGKTLSGTSHHIGSLASGGVHHAGRVASNITHHAGGVGSATTHHIGGVASNITHHAGGVGSATTHHIGGVASDVPHRAGAALGRTNPEIKKLLKGPGVNENTTIRETYQGAGTGAVTGAAYGFATGGPIGAVAGFAGGAEVGAAEGLGQGVFDTNKQWFEVRDPSRIRSHNQAAKELNRIRSTYAGKVPGLSADGNTALRQTYQTGLKGLAAGFAVESAFPPNEVLETLNPVGNNNGWVNDSAMSPTSLAIINASLKNGAVDGGLATLSSGYNAYRKDPGRYPLYSVTGRPFIAATRPSNIQHVMRNSVSSLRTAARVNNDPRRRDTDPRLREAAVRRLSISEHSGVLIGTEGAELIRVVDHPSHDRKFAVAMRPGATVRPSCRRRVGHGRSRSRLQDKDASTGHYLKARARQARPGPLDVPVHSLLRRAGDGPGELSPVSNFTNLPPASLNRRPLPLKLRSKP